MQKTKTQKGITLIALIITIIVMLILVGVTVTVALNGGLFSTAKKATDETQLEAEKEQLLSIALGELNDYGEVVIEDLDEAIAADGKFEGTGGTYTSKKSGNTYTVGTNASITLAGKTEGGSGGEDSGDDDSEVTVPATYKTSIEGLATGVTLIPYEDLETETSSDIKAGVDAGKISAVLKETINGTETIAVVPKGFEIINGIEETKSISEGLVIQDAKGNEFVWIPVTYEATGEKDENGLYPGFLSTFVRSNVIDEYHSEPYALGYSDGAGTEEAKDYYDMMRSVQNNKGFYVGRYEAGAQKEDLEGNVIARTNVSNGTSKVVVKRDCYPYNYVGWGSTMSNYTNDVTDTLDQNQGKGAVYLSKHLLDGQETGATSTLMYGVQWDAMLRFMGKLDETDSTEWGNYIYNEITINRETAKYTSSPDSETSWTTIANSPKEKAYEEDILLTTGASDEFKLKNIYDVAGNVLEWTMESFFSVGRVIRGGPQDNTADWYPAASRFSYYEFECYSSVGFRPALYITN